MKNKKGFTLVELLAVLVIIGIIMGIAIPAYQKVSQKTSNNNTENIKSSIELAAEKYASDTGITVTNAQTLIDAGYLSADDSSGNIYDSNKQSLNCNVINVTGTEGNYSAEINDNASTNEGGTCILPSDNGLVCSNDNVTYGSCDKWYSGTLYVKAGTEYTKTDDDVYSWTNDNGYNSNEEVIKINSENIKTTYHLTIRNKNGNIIYMGSSLIKLDNEIPAIINKGSEIDYSWTADKTIIINAIDNGSGILGYSFSESPICPIDDASYQSDNTFKLTKNGTYFYCVRDKSGNTNSSSDETLPNNKIEVRTIDTIPGKSVITSSDGIPSESIHSTEKFTLSFSVENKCQDSNCSKLTYYYGTDFNNLNIVGESMVVNAQNDAGKRIYVKACNEAKQCGAVSSEYHILIFTNTYPAVLDPSYPVYTFSTNSCNALCQMQANSEAWWEAQYVINSSTASTEAKAAAKVKQLELNNANKGLVNEVSGCESGQCTFQTANGVWHDANGNPLYSVSSLDFSNMDFSSLTNMDFSELDSLSDLDLSSLANMDFSNLDNLNLGSISDLSNLDLSGLNNMNFGNIGDLGGMDFSGLGDFSMDLSGLDSLGSFDFNFDFGGLSDLGSFDFNFDF